MKQDSQFALFDKGEWWDEYWRGMPEFIQEDLSPFKTISVLFQNDADIESFERLIGYKVDRATRYTSSTWYPEAEEGRYSDKRYANDSEDRSPRYPIYVISKGRWESRLTSKAFESMGTPYRIVVEPSEYKQYALVIDPEKILTLPSDFSKLGKGSIPVRNWVWDHASASGVCRHWVLDDNLNGFYRLNRNLKVPVSDATIFRTAEDFVDRFDNVAISGFHYFMFASRKTKLPPFYANRRIYSCILIKNDLPYRWRGRYNEDTDLSIRALKDGWCTVLFNAFLTLKSTTMTMKGGNTDELYKGDGRLKMAQSLVEQHPDVTSITWKWGRWQHHVDYSPFEKNELRLRSGIEIPEGVDNHGMYLKMLTEHAQAVPNPSQEVIAALEQEPWIEEAQSFESVASPLVPLPETGSGLLFDLW